MKRMCLLTFWGLLIWSSVSSADQIIIYGENRDVLLQLEGMQTNSVVSGIDKPLIADGLMSDYDDIRVAAIKVIMIHRLKDLWITHRKEFDPVVGTSKKLIPIVDAVFDLSQQNEKTLIDLLPEQSVNLLPLESKPRKPRAKNGDVPLEDVLLDVSVKDVSQIKNSAYRDITKNKLKEFQLSVDQKKRLNKQSSQ